MRRSLIGCLFALGCLGTGLLSCDDDDDPRPCDGNHIGVVHGYVLAAGEAPRSPVSLLLTSTDPGHNRYVDTRTETDASGWYELLVPDGTYTLDVRTQGQHLRYSRAGLVSGSSPPDTLTLSGRPLRVDIHLGAATVDLDTPACLDSSEWASVTFYPHPLNPGAGREISAGAPIRDQHARIEVNPMLPGTYRLRVGVAQQEFWLPGTEDPELADQLEVGTDTPAHYATALGEAWYLSGAVRGAWQTLGLSRPFVYAFTPDSSHLATARVETDGSFRMTLLLQRPVRLLVNAQTPWTWLGGSEFAEADEFLGALGESVAAPPLVGSGLECRIEPPNPMQVVKASVTLVDVQGHSAVPPGFRPPSTNPLTLPCLQPGTYFLRLVPKTNDQDWLAQWFDQAELIEQATPIEVPSDGGIAQITMRLLRCPSISGRVLEADGTPAGGRRVELFAVDDPSQGEERSSTYAVTDEETGEFALHQLSAGEYHLGVRYTLTTLVWYPGTLLWSEAEVLTLASQSQITGLEWSLVE